MFLKRRTIILHVDLYGCETWSLTIREEQILRIYGPKREEATGDWRKLYEEPHNLYSPPNIRMIKSRRIKWVRHVAHIGVEDEKHKISTGNPRRKNPLSRPRHR
jgi:hypothetical protein